MKPIPRLSLVILLAGLPTTLPAQGPTGRTLRLLAPAVVGQTASYQVLSPASATGNFYAVHWCAPPFSGTSSFTVPGITFLGTLRIDPLTSIPAATGVLGASGSQAHGIPIPNVPPLVGYAFDLQSADLATSTMTVAFSDNELALTISDTVPVNMVPIPAGSFQMGSNAAAGSPYYSTPDERPVHTVHITRSFWMSEHEVTQAEYLALMGNNPSYAQPPHISSYNPILPVERVSWNDAVAYCAALTTQEAAASRLPSGYEYRLPTEAEWEYCCRAGTTSEFHYGPTLMCGQANFRYSTHSSTVCATIIQTMAVGSYAPNAWGLYDMHGNVGAWCLDSWDGSPNYPIGPVSDPLGTSGTYRVGRGGALSASSDQCRSANRHSSYPWVQYGDRGFRVVLAPIL